jgi:hypothetical protein
LLGLLFEPEDGGDIFLRNIGLLSPYYTALRYHLMEMFNLILSENIIKQFQKAT